MADTPTGPAQDYRPIACMEHERLEFAVLKRQKLALQWRPQEAGAALMTAVVLPTDVVTRNGAEWLHGRRDDGENLVLRLDWIVEAKPYPGA